MNMDIKEEFAIIYLCNYCKQTTKHLVKYLSYETYKKYGLDPTKYPNLKKYPYLIYCEDCGFSHSISIEEYDKYQDTKEAIKSGRAYEIVKKSEKLHNSEEYKERVKKSDEEINEILLKWVDEFNKDQNPNIKVAKVDGEELNFQLSRYFIIIYCFNLILLRIGHPEMTLTEQLIQPILNIVFIGILLLVPYIIYQKLRYKRFFPPDIRIYVINVIKLYGLGYLIIFLYNLILKVIIK